MVAMFVGAGSPTKSHQIYTGRERISHSLGAGTARKGPHCLVGAR